MIQMRCPRCGETVSFTAYDQTAMCPGCQHGVQVQPSSRRSPPSTPNKDRDITNAMLICLGIVVFSFGIPIVAGLLGSGAAKFCEVESTPAASVYDDGELQGQTPLRIPRASTERFVALKAEGFTEGQLRIPATEGEPAECKLTLTLQQP